MLSNFDLVSSPYISWFISPEINVLVLRVNSILSATLQVSERGRVGRASLHFRV